MSRFTRWQDWVTMVIGVAILFSPFYLQETSNNSAIWAAVVIGVLLLAAGLVAAFLEETSAILIAATAVVGAALFLAPWVVAYTDLGRLSWMSWIGGLLAIAVAATEFVIPGRRALPSH